VAGLRRLPVRPSSCPGLGRLTAAEAEACFADDKALDKVLGDVQSGQTLGVRQTPTLFINDQNYLNPGGPDAIAAILRQVGR